MKSKSIVTITLALSILGLLCWSCIGVTNAAASEKSHKPITLRVAHYAHPKVIYHQTMEIFADEVKKRTNGGISFEIYPAGGLLKGGSMLEGIKGGLTDIGLMSFAYYPGETPFSADAQMIPFGWNWETVPAIIDAAKAFMDEEIAPFNQKLLMPLPLIGIWFLRDQLKDVNNPSLKGRRVRTPGGTMREYTKALEGVVISMPSSEITSAVNTGVIDGFWTSLSDYMGFDLFNKVPYIYDTGPGCMFIGIWWSINLDTWKKLPDDWQQIILDEAEKNTDLYYEMLKKQDRDNFKLAEQKGCTVVHLTDNQIAVWKKKVQPAVQYLVKKHGSKMQDWLDKIQEITGK